VTKTLEMKVRVALKKQLDVSPAKSSSEILREVDYEVKCGIPDVQNVLVKMLNEGQVRMNGEFVLVNVKV
jgi:hypothetical protein